MTKVVLDGDDPADQLRRERGRAAEIESLSVTLADPAAFFEVLVDGVWPALRTLTLREDGFDLSGQDLPDEPALAAPVVKRVAAALPALRRLEVSACGLASGLGHPALRELVLAGLPFTRGLSQLALPALTALTWNLPADVHGVAAGPGAFSPIWKGRFPALRSLDVYDADLDGDFWSTAMLTSAATETLRVLRAPAIGKPATLIKHAPRLSHLARIEVAWIEPASRATALSDALPALRVVPRAAPAPPPRGTRRRFYTFPGEVFVAEWDGFSADALRELASSVVSVALYHGVAFTPEEERAFAREASTRFEELRMPGGHAVGSPFGDDLAIELAGTLADSRWRRWSLQRARLTRTGVDAIVAALGLTSPLRDLALYSRETGLGAALAPALPGSGLHRLRLEGEWVRSTADARTVAAALAATPSLRAVGLDLDRAEAGAIDAFLDELDGAPVENLALGDELDGTRLARILAAHRSLRDLNAADSTLTDTDLTAIAGLLGAHPNLRSMRATRLDITPAGIDVLAAAVAASGTLTTLELDQDQSSLSRYASCVPLFDAIGASGRPFALTIRVPRTDEHALLDLVAANRLTALRGYSFSPEGFRRLLDLLPAATALADLDLAHSKFDPNDTALLRRTLPATKLRTFGFAGGTLLQLKKPDLGKLLAAVGDASIERLRLNVPWAQLLGPRGTPTPVLRHLLLQTYDDQEHDDAG